VFVYFGFLEYFVEIKFLAVRDFELPLTVTLNPVPD